MVKKLSVRTPGQGLHEITGQVQQAVRESGVGEGLLHGLHNPITRQVLVHVVYG